MQLLDLGLLDEPVHELLSGLARLRRYGHEGRDAQTEGLRIHVRVVTPDDAQLLQLADAVADRGGGQSNPLGYAGVAGPAVFLKDLEDAAVDRIELHGWPECSTQPLRPAAPAVFLLPCGVRVLFIGDVFATPGMVAAQAFLKEHHHEYDLVIVNGENSAGGFGITRKHFEQLRNAGADVVTLGNHGFDKPDAVDLLETSPRLLRAANFPPGTPGLGAHVYEARNGGRVAVMQLMGRVFMDPLDCPFRTADDVLEGLPTGVPVIVEFHAEATSEKKVMGFHLAGRVAAVLGTHTHVTTADEAVFRGTAYITDVGMTGVQHSSIGMAFEEVHGRFVGKVPVRYRPAEGPATLNAVVLELDGVQATSIQRLRWEADG